MKTKVVLIGRHTSDLPEDIEVVKQENVVWSTDGQECYKQFYDIIQDAKNNGAKVLLQNVPGILASVIKNMSFQDGMVTSNYLSYYTVHGNVGIIISVPGERTANVTKTSHTFADIHSAKAAAEMVTFANSRAKVEIDGLNIKVTVDPITPFVFDRIVWI